VLLGWRDGAAGWAGLALQAINHLVHKMGRQDCHFAFVGDGEARIAAIRLSDLLGIRAGSPFRGGRIRTSIPYLSTGTRPGTKPRGDCLAGEGDGVHAFGLPSSPSTHRNQVLAGAAAAYAAPADITGLARLVSDCSTTPRGGRDGPDRASASRSSDSAGTAISRPMSRSSAVARSAPTGPIDVITATRGGGRQMAAESTVRRSAGHGTSAVPGRGVPRGVPAVCAAQVPARARRLSARIRARNRRVYAVRDDLRGICISVVSEASPCGSAHHLPRSAPAHPGRA